MKEALSKPFTLIQGPPGKSKLSRHQTRYNLVTHGGMLYQSLTGKLSHSPPPKRTSVHICFRHVLNIYTRHCVSGLDEMLFGWLCVSTPNTCKRLIARYKESKHWYNDTIKSFNMSILFYKNIKTPPDYFQVLVRPLRECTSLTGSQSKIKGWNPSKFEKRTQKKLNRTELTKHHPKSFTVDLLIKLSMWLQVGFVSFILGGGLT